MNAVTNTCACGKPTTGYCCTDCTDRLGRCLGDIPNVEEELDLTLSRQRRFNTQIGGSRDAETPLAYNARASTAIGNLRALLVSWVKLCDEEHVRTRVTDAYPDDTLTAMSRWLLWRVDGLALHPAGPDAVDELCDAVDECHRVIDRPPERIYAGPCDSCGADLNAAPGAATVTCPECQASYDLAERREWLLEQVEDRLATATEIARALVTLGDMKVTPSAIRGYVHRGRLTAHHMADGQVRYRVGDVVDLVTDTQSRAG